MFETVLFDLDGTLVDSAPDLCLALNTVLAEHNRPLVSLDAIRPWVSRGTPAMIKIGFGVNSQDSQFEILRQQFLNAYGDNLCVESRLFDGIEKLIRHLGDSNIPWGIVTNKPARYTDPLVDLLQFPNSPGTIISGDTLTQKKPDPAPLILACENLGRTTNSTVYVGDDRRDIRAGIAAGMHTIAVGYGYTPPDEDFHQWGADNHATSVKELTQLLTPNN
jgi:N-acetyl-D-muramate 6-phosphate phosphatase